MRGQSTIRNLSAALKLAFDYRLAIDATVEVAYDKHTRSWTAWQVDTELHQVGIAGQGKDPMAAVEAMIENNRNNEE